MTWNGWEQLSPLLQLANFWDSSPGGGFGPRYIAQHQILFVQSGDGSARIGRKRYDLQAGDLVFYGPNEQHHIQAAPGERLHLIGLVMLLQQQDLRKLPSIDTHVGDKPFRFPQGKPRCPLSPPPSPHVRPRAGSELRHLCESLALTFIAKPNGNLLEKRGLVLMLFEAYHQAMRRGDETARVAAPHRRHIATAQRTVRDNLLASPTIAQLAKPSKLRPSYFARLFKQETGLSVRAYTNQQRLLAARRMVVEGQLNVQQIAQAVGYDDEFYFSRLFRKQFGLAPSMLRKRRTLA